MGFPEQLKKARKKMNYTQQQVADKMGITKSAYCGYETGKRQPDVKKIKQLAEILNTSGDILLETNITAKNEECFRNNQAEMYHHADSDDDFQTVMAEIGVKDPKARQLILDYWHLSSSDKELFWKFVDRVIKK